MANTTKRKSSSKKASNIKKISNSKGRKTVKSRGNTMDVKPPKDFKKKDEKYFAEEEAKLEAEAQRLLEEKKESEVEVNVIKNVKVNVEKSPKRNSNKQMTNNRKNNYKRPVSKKQSVEKISSKVRSISKVFAVLATVVNVSFIVRLFTTNMLPAKYIYPATAVLILISLFYLFKAFRKKTKKVTLVLLDILAIIISAGLVFATAKINEVFSFISSNIDNKQYAVYDVIVNKNAAYEKISDVKDKEIVTYKELVKDVSDDKLKEAVSKEISGSSLKFYADLDSVFNTVADNNENVIVVNDGTYAAYVENMPKYAEGVKIIGTIKIEMDGEAVEASKTDLTNTPFILYISGIDTRTGTMPSRSLSDVNIIAVINPNSKHIQLVSIPRDAYVMLHGTTGLPDKLTHAGSRGGVALSQATLEDLYGIKIDRYVRVNFNFVEKLVDAVGGITVYSDVDTFTTLHEKCVIKPGNNDLNGKCAIGFSRERYAYADGDRHRGRNQLQVIEKIFDKVTSGTTIISKYSDILNSLNGTFDSNMSMDDITSLARMQLDNMAKWKIEDFSVTGSGAKKLTNSYPNQELYVMDIDAASLETAKQKIQAVLSE